MVTAGTVIGGKYRVEREIGRGGMGCVLAAVHVQLEQPVAIKMLLADATIDPGVVARFLREARSAARLKSSHVCRVVDVGELDGGAPYMVMELLDGCDLHTFVRTRGPVPLAVAVDYVLQVTEALVEAHALGIVHRDLKPGNLFLTTGPNGAPLVKVLDFGIAKAAQDDPTQGLTNTVAIMGTPQYMSPEQLRASRDVDGRSDIWSLGVVLYQLVAGVLPWVCQNLTALVIEITTEPHRPLLHQPAELTAVIDRCLEKDPTKRYASIAELAAALAMIVAPTSGLTPVSQPAVLTAARPATTLKQGERASAATGGAAEPSRDRDRWIGRRAGDRRASHRRGRAVGELQ